MRPVTGDRYLGAIVPIARAMNWKPFAIAVATVLLISIATSPGRSLDLRMYAVSLRTCALLLGAAASFTIVDECNEIVSATPLPRWFRLWSRALVSLIAAGAVWVLCMVLLGRGFPAGTDLGQGGVAIESALLMIMPLALAALIGRTRSESNAPVIASGVMLLLVVCSLPVRDVVWPNPGDWAWDAAHAVWALACLVPLALLTLAARRVP